MVLPESLDRLMRGRIKGDRRYLGNGCWQRVNVEESRLNDHLATSQTTPGAAPAGLTHLEFYYAQHALVADTEGKKWQ
jgi:hypothetical protein